MKCDKCNGSGSINTHPYRTAFNKVKDKVVRPTIGLYSIIVSATKSIASVLYNWWLVVVFAICVCTIIYGVVMSCNNHQRRQEKERWVTVQYDDHGQAIRCWVDNWTGNSDWDIPKHVSDHYSRMLIANEDDGYGWILEKMGASNDMKCIR